MVNLNTSKKSLFQQVEEVNNVMAQELGFSDKTPALRAHHKVWFLGLCISMFRCEIQCPLVSWTTGPYILLFILSIVVLVLVLVWVCRILRVVS